MKSFFSKLFFTVIFFSSSAIFAQEVIKFLEKHPTFSQWKTACKQALSQPQSYSLLTKKQFTTTIKNFLSLMHEQLNNEKKWSNDDSSALNKLLDCNDSIFYTQRLSLPKGTKVAFHGDLHGNVQALNSYLSSLAKQGYLDSQNTFHITDENFYLIFLGDYVDRGKFGMETLYTITRLKLENPDQVFMVRGNHEDVDINMKHGFIRELKRKCGITHRVLELVNNLYTMLPVALYIGVGKEIAKDYILCCHGGWELGYDPLPLLQSSPSITYHAFDTLERENIMAQLPLIIQCELSQHLPHTERKNVKYIDPKQLGFLWNDFIATDTNEVVHHQMGRGWKLGKPLTDSLRKRLANNDIHIRAIFRAHQHGDKDLFSMMLKDGVAKLWNPSKKSFKNNLWDGIVCTFLVAPYTGYSNTFDAWGELEIGSSFETSKLTIHRNYNDIGA